MMAFEVELAENRYGKSRVRLHKVVRNGAVHDLYEWNVQVLLQGDFEAAHVDGDNSKILATDTMKNTVYSRAKESKATAMEEFAKELIEYILPRNPQVSHAQVTIEEALWKRMTVDGKPHDHSFMHGSNEVQTTVVERATKGPWKIVSGLDGLHILKTTKSAFEGYIKESLTTLPETKDRIFGTVVKAEWTYTKDALEFNAARTKLREAMLKCFAGHDSKSVQETLYAMAKAAIEVTPQIDDIKLTLPNKHSLLFDLKRFGQENKNEIFVPTDEPHGTIEARVIRKK
jgi:urate oxidase